MKSQKVILKQGIVARDVNGSYPYFGWPSVCKDENGTLYAVASRGVAHICPFGHDVLYTSHDNGETWSEPNVISDDPFDNRDAGILSLGNGRMLLTYFNHDINRFLPSGKYKFWLNYPTVQHWCTEEQKQEALDAMNAVPEDKRYGGSYVRLSEDYGKTWGEAIHIPLSCPHGPTVMNDGRLLYVGTPFELEAYRKATGDMTEYDSPICAIVSSDGGKTWTKHCEIPMPREWSRYPGGSCFFCEAHVMERKNGALIAVIRRGDNKDPSLASIFLYVTYSQNGGKTWTIPVRIKNCDGKEIVGAPGHLCEMQDGGIVLSYSHWVAPCGSRAIISHDGGYTWGEEILLSAQLDLENDDTGYPATVQLDTGELFTVYYQRYLLDGRPSLLYTKWNPNR